MANSTQNVATHHNTVAKRTPQQCCDILRWHVAIVWSGLMKRVWMSFYVVIVRFSDSPYADAIG